MFGPYPYVMLFRYRHVRRNSRGSDHGDFVLLKPFQFLAGFRQSMGPAGIDEFLVFPDLRSLEPIGVIDVMEF